MQLCRLVYYSKYDVSAQHGVADDLKHILSTAIRSNSGKGITGGLIFNRQFFGQVLEGDHSTVTQTFVRINGDRRHSDIVVAGMEPVSARLFGAWSMGYAGKSELFQAACLNYGLAAGFNPLLMSASDLTAFILTLVTQEQNVASS
jgi:Sensors of blue-light using FAD